MRTEYTLLTWISGTDVVASLNVTYIKVRVFKWPFYGGFPGWPSNNTLFWWLGSSLCNFLSRKCILQIFFYLVCEAIGTAATPGLLYQPRVIVKMIVEKQMECMLAGETEVLGENLPHRHFCPSQHPTWPDPGLNPGRRGGKLATNQLSYGAAYFVQ
jgi:hypothetical protein